MNDLQFYLLMAGAIVLGLALGAAACLYFSRNDDPIA